MELLFRKKNLSFLLFLILAQTVVCQNSTKDFYWKEKTYRVYPVRGNLIPHHLLDDRQYRSGGGVVPVQQHLPSGEYIVFYELEGKRFKWYKLKHAYSAKDTLIPFATFRLVDGKKNGSITFYNKQGEATLTGNYLDDLPHGGWRAKYDNNEFYGEYKQGLKNGIFTHTTTLKNKKSGDITVFNYIKSYRDGDLYGISSFYNSQGGLKSTYNYENGSRKGEFTLYNYKGMAETKGYYTDSVGEPVLDCIYNLEDFKNHNSFKLNTTIDELKENNTPYLSDVLVYSLSLNSCGSVISFRNLFDYNLYTAEQKSRSFHGDYVEYDYAGRPKVIKKYKYGYLAEEPVYLDYNGDTINRLQTTVINDTTVKRVYSTEGYIEGLGSTDYTYALINDKITEYKFKGHSYKHPNTFENFEKDTFEIFGFSPEYYSYVLDKDTMVLLYRYLLNGKPIEENYLYLKTGEILPGQNAKYYENGNIQYNYKWLKEKGTAPQIVFEHYSQDGKFMMKSLHKESRDEIDFISDCCWGNVSFYDSIFYKGKPYTGKIIEVSEKNGSKNFTISENITGLILKNKELSHKMTVMANVKDGILDGTSVATVGKDTVLIKNFKKGKLHGNFKWFDYHYSGKGSYIEKGWYLKWKSEYKDGLLHGVSILYNYDYPVEQLEYKNDTLNGKAIYFDHREGMLYGQYKNGMKDGEWKLIDTSTGIVKSIANYKADISIGIYKEFYETGIAKVEGSFEKGYFVGTWYRYYPSGILRSEENYSMEDSIFYMGSILNFSSPKVTNVPGVYKYYFNNGNISHQGVLGKYGQPQGVWEYYHEAGGKIYEIDYMPGSYAFINLNGEVDTITHVGKCTEWYADGKLKMEGLLLSASTKFDCARQFEFPDNEVFYLLFRDQNEQVLLDKGIGKVVQLNRNNGIEFEGEVVNGLKQGVWRYYDLNGKLNKVGAFVDNRKQGRWLEGDLEFVHFEDLACFNPYYLQENKEIKSISKKISVKETFYDNDIPLFTNYYNQNLDKAEEKISSRKRKRKNGYD